MADDRVIELRRWADAVEDLIERAPLSIVKRVMVFSETASTQDAAAASGGAEPGLLVLAGRQTAGRGRLGRSWDSGDGLGVAATFTLDVPQPAHPFISLGAGVAVAEAIERCLPPDRAGAVGLRWPNDAVERSSGRKLAGVLVESKGAGRSGGPLLLLGIGVNVLQSEADFDETLRASAASVAMLGSTAGRLDLILALAASVDRCVAQALADEPRRDLLERWKRRDVLTGRPAAFAHDGRVYEGIVREIRPDLSLGLRTGDGSTVWLPALTTSLRINDARRRGLARQG